MTVREIQEIILFCKLHGLKRFAVGECSFEFGDDDHPLKDRVEKLASEVNKLLVQANFASRPNAPAFAVTGAGHG